MSRRRKVVIAICLAAAMFGGAGLWALPEVVRRVAVRKIPELTGRATSIEDIDLNLFTGRFAVKKLRMERRPGHGPEAFVEFDRLEGRVALSPACDRASTGGRPGTAPSPSPVEVEGPTSRVGISGRITAVLVPASPALEEVKSRTGLNVEPFGFDFSDLLALFVKPVVKQEPSRWTFSLGSP